MIPSDVPGGRRGAGRIAESGSHAALLAEGGLYAELFELQAAGYR